jgi:hypothetical protein
MKPTKAKKRNLPKLKLADLLRRRKMSLKQLLDEFGITTYAALLIRCDRMGVVPPEQDEFDAVIGTKIVSSPTEGVVVLEAPPVIDDATGKEIDIVPEHEDVVTDFGQIDFVATVEEQPVQKKRRKRDKDQTDE